MTTEQKIIRAKVGLLELAKQLGNVSQACKMMGYSRDSFYRFKVICPYFDENLLGLLPAPHVEGLYGCLDDYQNVSDPYSKTLLGAYNNRYPDKEQFTGGSACSGLYRGMKLWAAAVNEAGSLRQEDVIAAVDHARIAEGPGGPAEMVPGQHHVRMNMYIARAKNGRFEIVESLGAIDPDEAMVPPTAEVGRGPIS